MKVLVIDRYSKNQLIVEDFHSIFCQKITQKLISLRKDKGSVSFHKQVIKSHSLNKSRKLGRVWYKVVQFSLVQYPSESYMRIMVTQALYRFVRVHTNVVPRSTINTNVGTEN